VQLPPFQSLIDAHAAGLHRLLRRLVGPDQADDCLQETLLAALRAYPELRRADNLRAWLYTIARRKAIDTLRQGGRAIVDQRLVEAASGKTDGHLFVDDGLWEVVRELPDRQRTALVHRYVEDLPYREIASRMACSEEAARRSVHEGLKKLRMRIER
jgi:RNA polymerase sigma factor (sigma-70 family)